MSKGWTVVAGLVGGLIAVGAAAAESNERAEAERRRREQQLSRTDVVKLAWLMLAAVVAAIALAIKAGAMWPLVPFVVWFVVLRFMRASVTSPSRPARIDGSARREEMEAARVEREWVVEFGPDGVRQIALAKGAVGRILATEAAREGWLGSLADVDFVADQTMIAERSRRAAALRSVIAESAVIPNPTADDQRLRKDAEAAVAQLEAAVAQRVRMLLACAHEAEEVDRMLVRQREEAELDEKRDDVRGRLSAMVYGVGLTATDRDSDAADAVRARAAAFRELKGGAEMPVPDEPVGEDPEEAAPARPSKRASAPTMGNVVTGRDVAHRIRGLLKR